MKALKEKRISLRSLWRRGLVILSLFALVFASCGDSDSSEPDVQPSGLRALEIKIDGPTATQYLGQLVDLTGAKVTVKYINGETATFTYPEDKAKFDYYPKVVTGTYNNNTTSGTGGGFTGMKGVKVLFDDGKGNQGSEVKTLKPGQVIGIKRDNSLTDNPDPLTGAQTGETGVFTGGLHLTGDYTKPVYADTTDFTFEGLVLYGEYTNGKRMNIDFANVSWEIVPDYRRGTNADKLPMKDGVYGGWLQITVGEDVQAALATVGNSTTGANKGDDEWDRGITVRLPLEKVYTVSEADDALSWAVEPKALRDPYFFFEANTPKYWNDKLKDGVLNVKYTGDAAPKTVPISEAQKLIWWNLNPVRSATYNKDDAGIVPLDYTYNAKDDGTKTANTNPNVLVYYRGATLKVPVNVYTVFKRLQVEFTSGEKISLDDTTQEYDNDIKLPVGSTEADFVGKIKSIKAMYTSYNNKEAGEAGYDLSLLPGGNTPDPADYPDRVSGDRYTGPYYTTNFDDRRADAELKGASAKKDFTDTITLFYQVDSEMVESFSVPALAPDTIFGGSYSSAEKTFKAKVTWTLPTKK
jgi:hypothetical protein